jgi:hypothetical protein
LVANFSRAQRGHWRRRPSGATDRRGKTDANSEGAGGEVAVAGRNAEPDAQTENITAQEKEIVFAVAFTETKSKSQKNTGGRIRSISDTERNPASDTQPESEEEGCGKRTLAETKEEKENRRRKIAKPAQKDFTQTV